MSRFDPEIDAVLRKGISNVGHNSWYKWKREEPLDAVLSGLGEEEWHH